MSGGSAAALSALAAALAAAALAEGIRVGRAPGAIGLAIPPVVVAAATAGVARVFGSTRAGGRAIAGALAGGLAAAALVGHAVPAVILSVTVLAVAAFHARGAARRRQAAVVAQLPEVAAGLATALRAGLSLRQALARAAREAPQPAAGELVRVARELELGTRVERSLDGLGGRIADRDLRLMVAAIEVQRIAGGDLAGALGDLADRLGERARLARELRALTAQARLTAWMVGALPLAAAVLVELAAPGALRGALLSGPGLLALIVALGLYAAGAGLVVRISRVTA